MPIVKASRAGYLAMLLERGHVFPLGSNRSFAPIHEYAVFGCEAQPRVYNSSTAALAVCSATARAFMRLFERHALLAFVIGLSRILPFSEGYQPRPASSFSCHPGYLFAAPVLLVLV
jgi:hypothetical protein